jgi:GMP synthase-like glutamine amidotransferase
VVRCFAGEILPPSLAGVGGLCILGGPMSANDALSYYPALFALTREAFAQRIPVIGHCLGGQIMARVLGGTVQPSSNVEIGWAELQTEGELGSAWFAGKHRVRLFEWHGESFSIPPGATRIVTGAYCANQAFVYDGIHLGMQFHIEVDEEKVRQWLIAGHDELIRCASPAVQQADAILPTLAADLGTSQSHADALYTRWLAAVHAAP